MTMIEYLLYICKNKGILINGESRLSEVYEDDLQKALKSHFIEIEYNDNNQVEYVSLTQKGYDYITFLY